MWQVPGKLGMLGWLGFKDRKTNIERDCRLFAQASVLPSQDRANEHLWALSSGGGAQHGASNNAGLGS